ncbi:CAP domain-containing protein [Bauldia sp.]|uniref:CAP domain-containing protein n=1 Tax=Bauldia sp. TaxID=2575872 RepID=UPI003BAB8E1B
MRPLPAPHLRRSAAGTAVIVLALAFVLSACQSLFKPEQIIEGGRTGPATVNAASAAQAISSYRRSRGLPAVTVDSKLNAIAASHSRAMARADRMAHVVRGEGSFQRRLANGGYDAAIAVENIAAGHRNFNEVLAGWKASRSHNANLLKPGVTSMGIAVSYTAEGRFGNFWTLVLAAPDTRRTAALGAVTPGG